MFLWGDCMSNCLLIGGSGFAGINICKAFITKGYNVSIASKKGEHYYRIRELFPKINIIPIDFTSYVEWHKILRNIDFVYHMVSTTTPTNKDLLYDFTSNVLPTIKLLEACVNKSLELIYFSSGGAVYGLPRYMPIDERHRTDPISAYGIHKLSVEKCIEYYGRMYGLKYRILRISNLYGAYQDCNRNQGVIAVFLSRILKQECIEIWGSGSAIRDYIYIDDLINFCFKLMHYKGEERIFNVGSGKGYSLNEVVELFRIKTNNLFRVKYLPCRIQDVSANVLDISLSEKELDWHPQISLSEGIDKMISLWDDKRMNFSLNFEARCLYE